MRNRIVRWADAVDADGDGSDIVNVLHVGIVLALACTRVANAHQFAKVIVQTPSQLFVAPAHFDFFPFFGLRVGDFGGLSGPSLRYSVVLKSASI